MQTTRRLMLTATGRLLAAAALRPALIASARAQSAGATTATPAAGVDPRMADRAEGRPDAPVTVTEWFSFTCPHCAHFAADVYPEIKAKLIDTGKLRVAFREYPRDQVDLMAAMVARSLPAERYVPFKDTLLASQARWAFARDVDPKEELAKMAALAGMPREMFDRVVADETLKAEILAAQAEAEKAYNINSTPTFVTSGHPHTGEAGVSYDAFSKMAGV